MIDKTIYNIRVDADTRNHKGYFVRDTNYTLIDLEKSGWALICQDHATCHYVDPACIHEISDPDLQDNIPNLLDNIQD